MAELPSFLAAKRIIDEYQGTDGGEVKAALDSLKPEEHMVFLEWILQQGLNAEEDLAKQQQAQPRLTVQAYTTALNEIKFDDTATIDQFFDTTSGLSYRTSAEPIRLGIQDDLQYFLRPQSSSFDVEPNEDSSADLHPYYVRFVSNIGTTPLLQFGLHLGMLEYTMLSDTKAEFLSKTPLHLFLNPVQTGDFEAGSMWLVMQRTFCDDQNNLVELPDRENAWQWCGLSNADRPPFDCLQLFSAQDVQTLAEIGNDKGLGGSRKMFDTAATSTAQVHCLIARAVTKQEIKDAVSTVARGG